jgi:hypothetical protein
MALAKAGAFSCLGRSFGPLLVPKIERWVGKPWSLAAVRPISLRRQQKLPDLSERPLRLRIEKVVITLELDCSTGRHFAAKARMARVEPGLDYFREPMLGALPLYAICYRIQVEEPVLHRVPRSERKGRSPHRAILLWVDGRVMQENIHRRLVRVGRPKNAGLQCVRPIPESITFKPLPGGIQGVGHTSGRGRKARGPSGICAQDAVDPGEIVRGIEIDELVARPAGRRAARRSWYLPFE